jgi:predicted HTH transcriptional regulator
VSAPVILAPVHAVRDLLTKARVSIQDRKRKKRDKIMLALTTKTKITNDEVEKLLHVSDATATRYLSALEKEGKIKQVGKTGHGVVYSKI